MSSLIRGYSEEESQRIFRILSFTNKSAIVLDIKYKGPRSLDDLKKDLSAQVMALYFPLQDLEKDKVIATNDDKYVLTEFGERAAKTVEEAWKESEKIKA